MYYKKYSCETYNKIGNDRMTELLTAVNISFIFKKKKQANLPKVFTKV